MSIKTKSIYAIGALVFLIAVIATKETSILSIPVAHAESPFDLIEEIQGKGALIIEVLVAATFIIYPIITVLLDPQFFIDILREDDILTIWQLSRDIMNVIFAFMLIGGAMATVVMANQEYLKKYALKFLLGIILVNFSWFFPRVILDVSNVVTANIYQLPSIVGTTCEYREKDGTMSDCKFPSKFLYFPTDDQLNDIRTHTPSSIYNNYQCISDNICYLPQSLVNDTNIPSGILAGLAMNHARIPEMNKVMNSLPTEWERMDANMIQQLISQIIRLGLQFILVMFIALILIGMAVALLVRIPILWITMAFMPLMFISFVLGDLLPTDFNTMQLIFKKFVHAAFLPAVLAVPLSVGFILINGLANSTAPDSAIMLSDSLGPILPGVNDLWEFLWVLVTIVVMWKGFKAALKVDSIFEQATSGITGIGDNIGKLAMNAPLSIPIIPMGKDANGKDINISLGAAKTKLNALQYAAGSGRLVEEVRGGLGGGSGTTNNINHVVVNTAVNTAVSSAITASNGNVLSETDLNAIVIAMRNANRNNPENINDTMMSDRIYDLLLAQNVNASQIERDNINAALASNPN